MSQWREGFAVVQGLTEELETLTRLLTEVKSGQRRVLLLQGEAGIGKSRLVGELARRGGVVWLLGAGQSIEQRAPYRAWRDLLAAYFDLDDPSRATGQSSMGLDERRQRVRERLTKVSRPWPSARLTYLHSPGIMARVKENSGGTPLW